MPSFLLTRKNKKGSGESTLKKLITLFAFVAFMFAGVIPAMADALWNFSFSGGSVINGFFGVGTFDVNNGQIVGLTGTLTTSLPLDTEALTLDTPGYFASNDNLFSDVWPFFDESGFSFNASGIDYNIYYAAEVGGSGGYIVDCAQGSDCITSNPYGTPSTGINFFASEVPEPAAISLIGLGLLIGGLARRRINRRR